MDYLRSDCILRDILEDHKSLTGFLDAIFGFLSRNTDFYHIQTSKDDKLGFPRGVKDEILFSCMQKYDHTLNDPYLEAPELVENEIEVATDENYQESHPIIEQITENNKNLQNESTNDEDCVSNNLMFSEAEYKNGSVYESYCWSQTLKDIELSVLLPVEVKLAKHVEVQFKSNFITIKTLLPKKQILLNCETWDKYRHNDVIWSISDGKLILSFDKIKECWWDKLFLSENSIDIKSVSSEMPNSDYSPDVQNAIEKLHIQKNRQEQTLKTLPLNETEQMSRLRQAWDAEGSPFKGQAFDPSIIQFN